jgi:hypothetical protein
MAIRYFAYFSSIIILGIGSTVNLHAQPLFPQWGPGGSSEDQPSNNSQTQVGKNGIADVSNIQSLGYGEIYLIDAINSVRLGNMSGFTENLNLSQLQFTSVLQSSPESEQKSIAQGGNYLVKSLQSGDATELNKNLNLSIQQFAPIVNISPWTRIIQPAPTAAGNTTETAAEPVDYSDTQLLALAGIHLSHVIRSLENGDATNLERNLGTSQQQLRQALED